MTFRRRTTYPSILSGLLLLATSLTVLFVRSGASQSPGDEYVVDESHPMCTNRGPGSEERPWCNLWGLHNRKFNPGAVVSVKAGEYVGDEDPGQSFAYHDGVNVYAGGTAENPFTLRAWPGHEGQVLVHSGKRDETYAYVIWGGHIRIKGIDFVGHVELPGTNLRLYSPRMFRFAIVDEPVRDVVFEGVRILHFQGADDDGLGCRFLDRSPVGQCRLTRSAEGWGRGIDLTDIRDFVFEGGEITCTDEVGREGLTQIRDAGLYMGADGIKSSYSCSNVTIADSRFGDCGHNNLMFTRCDSVLVERNVFKNELHRSASLSAGTGNTVRYNTFAAWEKMRVELRAGGGNALQFRTSNSKVHHNVFYGGGEPNHQGAINMAGLDSFAVSGNEIFNNVTLALNSLSFNLNDKYRKPFNMRDNRIFNNIFIGQSTPNGVLHWESATREAYLEGETFGNEFANNILYSPTGDPEILSYSGPRRTERRFTEDEFNGLEFASNNIFGNPGLADLNFEDPDFHIASSCIALNAGLPIDVDYDFEGKLLSGDGSPSIGPYASTISRLEAPGLLSPGDGTADVSPGAGFRWGQVASADAYHVQISADTTFDDPVLDLEYVDSSYLIPVRPLAHDSTYYWRVRVSAARGDTLPEAADCTPWSATHEITTAGLVTATQDDPSLPLEFALLGSFPNPFRTSTTIQYAIPEPADVHLEIYDVVGRVVTELLDERVRAGVHAVEWDAHGLMSGTYYFRFRAGDYDATQSVVLAR